MSMLFRFIFNFLMGGLAATRPPKVNAPVEDTEEVPETPEEVAAEFANFMQALGEEAGKLAKSASVTSPFERHMARHMTADAASSNSAFIECMLSALTDLADEIQMAIPESDLKTSVNREENEKYNIFKGHIEWELDKVDQLVYPISMELLRDGFIYMQESKSYVITVKVPK